MAEKRRRLVAPERMAEDGYHAGLAVRILPSTVHVSESADRVWKALGPRPGKQVSLAGPLGGAVWSQGSGYAVFGRGNRRFVSVQGAAGRSEHHRCSMSLGGLEDIQGAHNVDEAIATRVGDRNRHAGLGSEMEDGHRPRGVHYDIERFAVSNVDLLERGFGRNAIGSAGREVVDGDRSKPFGDQSIGHMGADETRCARDNRRLPHTSPTLSRFLRAPRVRPETAMILAAGRGTRLGEVGTHTPKVLMDVGGEPLLARHLRYLESEGVGHVVLNAHHCVDQVEAFLETYDGPLRLTLLVEPILLGTAGGVRNALPQLGADPFLVLYGDVLVDEPLLPLFTTHFRRAAASTLAVYQAASSTGKGVVVLREGWRVEQFVEKGREGPGLVN